MVSIALSVVNETIVSMETGDRREVSRRIGWKLSFLEEAGLKIGRKAWDARIHVPISIRTNEDLPEVVQSSENELKAASPDFNGIKKSTR